MLNDVHLNAGLDWNLLATQLRNSMKASNNVDKVQGRTPSSGELSAWFVVLLLDLFALHRDVLVIITICIREFNIITVLVKGKIFVDKFFDVAEQRIPQCPKNR